MNWSYIAGFFDGEGCVQKNKNQTGRYYPYLDITNTNLDVLKSIGKFLGSNGIRYKLNKPWKARNDPAHWLPRTHLTIYDKVSVQKCICEMFPYLIVKSDMAEWAMSILDGITERYSLRR